MAIFFNRLQRFDSYISRTSSCKVLMILDNFSGHGTASCLLNPSSVGVASLLASTTSRLQRMDAGIIASLNCRYRTMQYTLALDVMDLHENIYKTDQLTAMQYVKAI